MGLGCNWGTHSGELQWEIPANFIHFNTELNAMNFTKCSLLKLFLTLYVTVLCLQSIEQASLASGAMSYTKVPKVGVQ